NGTLRTFGVWDVDEQQYTSHETLLWRTSAFDLARPFGDEGAARRVSRGICRYGRPRQDICRRDWTRATERRSGQHFEVGQKLSKFPSPSYCEGFGHPIKRPKV